MGNGLPRHMAFTAATVALAVLGSAVAAQAAPYEFANFNLLNANQPFTFTNSTVSANIGVTNAPVTFNFTQQTGLSTADIPAFLNIAPVAPPSTFLPATSSGNVIDQRLSNLEQLSITSGPNGTGVNYLTMVFNGDILGLNFSHAADLTGDDANLTLPNVVVFSSAFGTFAPPGDSFDLGLATVTPMISLGAGGFLTPFNANIDGQFSGNFTATVPEPGSVALLAVGLLGGIGMIRRVVGRD